MIFVGISWKDRYPSLIEESSKLDEGRKMFTDSIETWIGGFLGEYIRRGVVFCPVPCDIEIKQQFPPYAMDIFAMCVWPR